MATTYIIKLVQSNGGLDRIGGLPTHIPEQFPIGPNGEPLAFVAQFEVVEPRIHINGARFIQVYQDPGDVPWPTAITLNMHAQENIDNLGRVHPLLPQREIIWEQLEEPVEDGDWGAVDSLSSFEEGKLQSSKAGGFCYYDSAIDPGDKFILQLREQGLATGVFGGHTLVLLLNSENDIEARLG
jgi:hypothetical protein